ncbi:MAG: SPOR domain-containing protein [Salinibacter sp.]
MSRHALGIMVAADALHAVLLERTEEETVVQFNTSSVRARGGNEELPFDEAGGMAPGMEEESDDVTIQFGDEGEGWDDMFMGSEFEDIGSEGGGDIGGASESEDTWNFQVMLDDLLDQCAERGYEDPKIAFCSTTSEVDRVELRLPPEESDQEVEEKGERGLPLPASRSELLGMLEEQYEGGVEDGRVGFVPMSPTGDGRQRVLALIARPGGSVLRTLETMQEETLARSPRAQLLDAEVSLYLGLARSVLQLPPGTPEKTILVRSGPEDTLVLFIEGNTLRQLEYLPELTADDSAETICSRVLLLQDEYGMGEVQHLMLVAEDNEGILADAFKSYFAGANLRLLRTHLPSGEETESGAFVAATGAALRLLDDPNYEAFFQPVNLLAKRYTASAFRLPVGWSVPALLGLLAITTLGFVWYYFMNASVISQRRTKLQALEQKVEQVDPDALQRRIDSLKSAAGRYATANDVVGTLLQGSNKWSRGLATVAEQINRIDGLSIKQWSPESETEVAVTGRSTSRTKIVRLAEQLNGDIQGITFTETRDVSLYEFQLTVPLDTTKPEAIEYWREQRGERLASVDQMTQSQGASSSSSPAGDTTASGPSADTASTGTPSASPSESGNEKQTAGTEWTVVVSSLEADSAAQRVARTYRGRLKGKDHPVQVRQSPENGRYRVGVGTFASFEAARSALRNMEEVLPPDAWLHKYSSPTLTSGES